MPVAIDLMSFGTETMDTQPVRRQCGPFFVVDCPVQQLEVGEGFRTVAELVEKLFVNLGCFETGRSEPALRTCLRSLK